MATDTYNVKDVSAIMGAIPLSGTKGESEWVAVEPVGDAFESKSDVEGNVTRFPTGEKRVRIKITTGQKSAISTILSAFLLADENTTNGGGVVPFILKDANALDLLVCSTAWVVGPPSMPYGKEANDREWTIEGVRDLIAIGV